MGGLMTQEELNKAKALVQPGIPIGGPDGKFAQYLPKLIETVECLGLRLEDQRESEDHLREALRMANEEVARLTAECCEARDRVCLTSIGCGRCELCEAVLAVDRLTKELAEAKAEPELLRADLRDMRGGTETLRLLFRAQEDRDAANRQLRALEKLIPRDHYSGDLPISENIGAYIDHLKQQSKAESEAARAELAKARTQASQLRDEREEAIEALENLEGVIRDNIPYHYDQGEADEDEANPEECVEYAAADIAKLKAETVKLREVLSAIARIAEEMEDAATPRGATGQQVRSYSKWAAAIHAAMDPVRLP